MKSLLATKVVALGLVLVALMAALTMIGGVAHERLQYRAQAAQSIATSVAGSQTLAGAVVTRQCNQTVESTELHDKLRVTTHQDQPFRLWALPQTSHWTVISRNEPRYRGLYKVNSFNLEAQAEIAWESLTALQTPVAKAPVLSVRCGPPQVEFAVTDVRGIRSVKLSTAQGELRVRSEGEGVLGKSSFAAPLELSDRALAAPAAVQISMSLVGLESLGFVPLANDNVVTLKSDWPHPSFQGAFLPQERSISASGFEATWKVSALASSARSQVGEKAGLCDVRAGGGETCMQAFGVDYIDPINPASLSDRAIKYGIMFIVLTFAGIVVLEVLKRVPVHPVQYLLIGAALASFFLLLLSLSEHISFALSYAVAASACVAVLTLYAKSVLGGWGRAVPMSGGLLALYGVLYVVLQSEQHALLAGSLLLFVVLAGVMLLTREVKWGSDFTK